VLLVKKMSQQNQTKQKSLIDKLQELEDKIWLSTHTSLSQIKVTTEDGQTVREARFLINRMCEKASE